MTTGDFLSLQDAVEALEGGQYELNPDQAHQVMGWLKALRYLELGGTTDGALEMMGFHERSKEQRPPVEHP